MGAKSEAREEAETEFCEDPNKDKTRKEEAMKEYELKYGCNPNQKPARVFMENGAALLMRPSADTQTG